MIDWLEEFGVGVKYILVVVGLGMAYYVFSLLGLESNKVLGYIFSTAPVWLPVITLLLFFEFWMDYIQLEYDLKQGRSTLEIKLPEEILKSPEAMELVLVQMHQSATPDNHVETYWDGKHPPTFSLELVSRGGDVKFYINTPTRKFKNLIETQLYAQYPGVEVVELDVDYTAEIPWDTNRFEYFSIHYGLKKADAYPLKTYIDFGLNMMPKEEEKVDPITSMLEMLGSIGPGEYYWIQILIEANKEAGFKEGSPGGFWRRLKPHWKDEAKKEMQKILDNAVKERASEDYNQAPNMLLTDTEKDVIKSIERSLGKNAFNTAIRGMYIAEKDAFRLGEVITSFITGWRGYDDLNRNAIGVRWRTDFDWNWWQDPSGRRREHYKKKELNEYKSRRYTEHNHRDQTKVFTVEELATIFHLPGQVASTPSLTRIPSKRSEPPSNLPV